jgi:hypothetical protein
VTVVKDKRCGCPAISNETFSNEVIDVMSLLIAGL